MQVSEIRRVIAPMFDTSDEYLRKKQEELFRQPSLRAYLPPGRRAAGNDREGLRASEDGTALLMLAAMVGGSVGNIGPEVVRLWEAPPVDTGGIRWASRLELCGAGLILLLSDARVRAHLHALEVDQNVPEVVFVWDDGRRTTFAPFERKDWRNRKSDIAEMARRAVSLPGKSVEKIAGLIQQEPPP